jgi:hypothetical protein
MCDDLSGGNVERKFSSHMATRYSAELLCTACAFCRLHDILCYIRIQMSNLCTLNHSMLVKCPGSYTSLTVFT